MFHREVMRDLLKRIGSIAFFSFLLKICIYPCMANISHYAFRILRNEKEYIYLWKIKKI